MVHVFHQIPFEVPSGMLQMDLFARIYERETRYVRLYTFSLTQHSIHNCRDAGMLNTGKCKSLDQSKSRGGPCCFPPLPVCVYCIIFFIGPLAQSNNSKTLYAKRFKPSTSTLWEKYSRICRNAFKCALMWKETSFRIDYEQVLFCIVPGMCI